jgi:hypothetical protein
VRRSTRAKKEIDWFALAGSDDEEGEGYDEPQKTKKKRVRDEDEDFCEGKSGKDEEDELSSEESEENDFFPHVPSLPYVVNGTEPTSLLHLPHGVLQMILVYLSPDQLFELRLNLQSYFLKHDVDAALSARAVSLFGAGADFRCYLAYKSVGSRINKGRSRDVFRVKDSDLNKLPHRTVHHRNFHYRYVENIYQTKDIIRASLKRFGSMAKLMKYKRRLEKRRDKKKSKK